MIDPAAVTFMRRLREGLDAGLELPEALSRGAAALPREARDTLGHVLRRMDGAAEEDEWGFDEDFTELVEPFFGSSTTAGGASRSRGPTACPHTAARCSPPTTRASCPGTRR